VLLVPGNHERGHIPYPLLALHPNLHLFDRPRTVVLEARGVRVAFAGFPYARGVRDRFAELLSATGHRAASADHRILCVHHCIEGATCGVGPGDGVFTFRDGDDVIRRADLPRELTLVMSGHIHRHQVLRCASGPTVVYAGSVERTSFAETRETKGVVRVDLHAAGVARIAFSPLPTRPMVVRRLSVAGLDAREARLLVASVVEATPPDAVVQVRVEGPPRAATEWLSAAALRELAGPRRNVYLGCRSSRA
jgi:DNA repair exonuclease SbcCD nuclease subunit